LPKLRPRRILPFSELSAPTAGNGSAVAFKWWVYLNKIQGSGCVHTTATSVLWPTVTPAEGTRVMWRLGVLHEIAQARNTDVPSHSRVTDFALGRKRPVPRERCAEFGGVPYLLDFRYARTLYATGIDREQAKQATFLYLHLRNHARGILSVPWEAGPVYPSDGGQPIFLFSPGRCGSTLLHNILIAAGADSLSEPDIYQAFTCRVYNRLPPLRPLIERATRDATQDLVSLFAERGRPLVIKLRAATCTRPAAILACAGRSPKTIFLTRQFESWAKSASQAFHHPPQRLVLNYKHAVECCAFLRRNSNCHLLHYEDLLENPNKVRAALGEFLGLEIPNEALAGAMDRDSQAETPLDQSILRARTHWEQSRAETIALWRASQLPQFCKDLGLD
jgi:hypothetical protein